MSKKSKHSHPFLMKAGQVAERLGTSKSFVYTLVRRGDIPVVRMGEKAVRIRSDDLEQFINDSLDRGQNGKTSW